MSFYDINNRRWLLTAEDGKLQQLRPRDQKWLAERTKQLTAKNTELAKELRQRADRVTI